MHWVPLAAGNAECCVLSDNWNDATSWSEDPAFGGPRRVPTAEDVVLIDASMFATTGHTEYEAVLNVDTTVNELIIASPQDGIRVNGTRALSVVGGEMQNHGFVRILTGARLALRGLDSADGVPQLNVLNNGEFTVDAVNSSTELRIDGSVAFSGTGNINLVGSGNFDRIVSVSDGPADTLTNGPDHTIRGGGRIGIPTNPLGIINQGVIEGSIGTLQIGPDDTGLVNTGTLRATGGGTLQLEAGTFDSTNGGLIHAADGSIVALGQDARILGGTITTEGMGKVATIGNGVDPIFAGSITNNGYIEIDTVNSLADLRIDGEVMLGGNGSLALVHSTFSRIISLPDGPADVLVNGPDHTIRGIGRIGIPTDPLDVVNQGVIEGSGTLLRIDPAESGLVNTGTLRAVDGGTLQLEAGTFDSTGGGLIHAAADSVVALGQDGRIFWVAPLPRKARGELPRLTTASTRSSQAR